MEIRYNPSLHAKLSVAFAERDADSFPLFGSANLTSKFEYSLTRCRPKGSDDGREYQPFLGEDDSRLRCTHPHCDPQSRIFSRP